MGLVADLHSREAEYRPLALAAVNPPPVALQEKLAADAWPSAVRGDEPETPSITGVNSFDGSADKKKTREQLNAADESPAGQAAERSYAAAPAAPAAPAIPAAPPATGALPQVAAEALHAAAKPPAPVAAPTNGRCRRPLQPNRHRLALFV